MKIPVKHRKGICLLSRHKIIDTLNRCRILRLSQLAIRIMNDNKIGIGGIETIDRKDHAMHSVLPVLVLVLVL